MTAITNSRRQVEIARELAAAEVAKLGSSSSPSLPPPPTAPADGSTDDDGFVQYPGADGGGAVRVLELDVEEMRGRLGTARGETFDCVWISEVVFHLHDRQLFFDSASAPRRTRKELASIRQNHLCPELGTVEEYAKMARQAGFRPRGEPMDITNNVAKTW